MGSQDYELETQQEIWFLDYSIFFEIFLHVRKVKA